jgi:hypothetical protein
VKRAVERKVPLKIIPVIIEGPPPAKPPRSLRYLFVNDNMMYFINSIVNRGNGA